MPWIILHSFNIHICAPQHLEFTLYHKHLKKAERDLQLNDTLAQITVDINSHRVAEVKPLACRLTFTCCRCAVFCCKLGAPKLTQNDIQRLETAGFHLADILSTDQTTFKARQDGSCILLSRDQRRGFYRCALYGLRPAFCRLYPFRFERIGHNVFALKLIPCCNGINNENGEKVNTNFISSLASSVLFELIDAGWL